MTTPKPPTIYPIPDHAPLSRCRSCGASIYWTVTPAGKRCPVDWEEKTRGQSHFRTCPHASEHSRRPAR